MTIKLENIIFLFPVGTRHSRVSTHVNLIFKKIHLFIEQNNKLSIL